MCHLIWGLFLNPQQLSSLRIHAKWSAVAVLMFPPSSHWGQTQKQLLHFNRLRFLASFTLAGSSELMSISRSSDQPDGNPVQWEIFSWLFTRHCNTLTKDIWKYLQRCIIRSVALGCSGKYSQHNVMTEKKEKKQLDERSQKKWAQGAPEPANLRLIREWKGIFMFPSAFPSWCLLQQMINLEFSHVCSLFSLQLPWVVTLDPNRSTEYLWKPSEIC